MILMNAPTSFAYIQLRKYHHHFTMLNRELQDCHNSAAAIKSYARDCNDRKKKEAHKPFLNFDAINFDLIAAFWSDNLPLNNEEKLAAHGIKADRYTTHDKYMEKKAA